MSLSCYAITEIGTAIMNSPEGRAEISRMYERGATPVEYIDFIAGQCDPKNEALMYEEFGELPASTIKMVIDAWALAVKAAKPFAINSVLTDEPVEFARARRTRLVVDIEDEGVIVSLLHFPGTPRAVVAAVEGGVGHRPLGRPQSTTRARGRAVRPGLLPLSGLARPGPPAREGRRPSRLRSHARGRRGGGGARGRVGLSRAPGRRGKANQGPIPSLDGS